MANKAFFPEIKLEEITLENFRGLPYINMNFDEKLTVIIGNNGSGKTTILDGIATFLHHFVHQTILTNQDPLPILQPKDIKNGQEASTGNINLKVTYEFVEQSLLTEITNIINFLNDPLYGGNQAEIRFAKINNEEESWYIVIDDDNDSENWISASWTDINIDEDTLKIAKSENNKWVLDLDYRDFIINPDYTDGKRVPSELWNNKSYKDKGLSLRFGFNRSNTKPIFSDNQNVLTNIQISYTNQIYNLNEPIPFLAYYGGKSIDLGFDESTFSSLKIDELYKDTLIPSKFNLSIFFNWLEQKQKIANTKLKDEITRILSDDSIANKSLVLEEITTSIINNQNDNIPENKELFIIKTAILDMLNDDDNQEYTNLRVEYPFGKPEVLIAKKEVSQNLNINQLSSGERNLLALVGDIAIRLIQLNPKVENPLKEGRGIVLIDEIALHLHPLWQRKVIPKLRAIFPEIQFVVTTHSPFVVQSVEASQRYILDEKGINILNLDSDLSYEVIVNDYFKIDKLFDEETEELLEQFNSFKARILNHEITIKNEDFLSILKKISNKSNEVKDIIARELRFIKNQSN